ncbi:MAG TPA: hypothetical protein VFZ20_02005 [Longimicrobium sp.]|nr:hypothetical protein [Longimicrobium sp.]
MKGFAFLLAAASCAALPLSAQTPLRVGQTVTGTLEESDPRMDDGTRYDAYVIRGQPGDRVVVRLNSDDFDAYLHYGRAGQGGWMDAAGDDDGGDGTNARLVITLDDGGAYELRASSFVEDQLGAYEISVSEARVVAPGRIRVGQTVQGELADGDAEGEGLEDHYLITGRQGEVVTVFAESDAFDPYLALAAEEGGVLSEITSDDDSGEGLNAQMVVTFDESGEYHVVVRGFDGDGAGAYTLRVETGAAEPIVDDEEMIEDDFSGSDEGYEDAPEFVYQGRSAGTVALGREVAGTLDGEADEAGWTLFYHDYTYRAAAGEHLVIQVSSEDLDAYVLVGRGQGDDFEALAEDDDGGEDLDSRLEFEVPQAGVYTIRVTTAAPDQAGAYALRVDRGN